MLCSSPSPMDSRVGCVRVYAFVGAFFLLDVGVFCWVGGGVLCLFSDLLISILSGLLSCFCFVFASSLRLDLGSLCFPYGVGARISRVVTMDDPSVDSITIGASSLAIPFPLPKASIIWLFLGVILHKSKMKHSIQNPYYFITRSVNFFSSKQNLQCSLLINVHACGFRVWLL